MNYTDLKPKFKNKKLIFDIDKVWLPSDTGKKGYKIGDFVFHINKKKQILSKYQIVSEPIHTEYRLTELCKLFGRFREYFNPLNRVCLKPIDGTWSVGDDYHITNLNCVVEFPFDLVVPFSEKIEKLRLSLTKSTFKEIEALWSNLH